MPPPMPPMPPEMSADMPPGMPPGAGPNMPPGGDGEVMMSIPRSAFEQLHQIVKQLATGLDELAAGMGIDGAGAPPAGPSMPPEMGEEGMEGASEEDEEFLRSLMEEGNAKAR